MPANTPETILSTLARSPHTMTEVRRAMGFPDDYHLPAQHKEAVHMLGNAVVPLVARDILEALQAQA